MKVYVAGRYSADNVLDVLKNIGRGQRTCARLFQLGFYPYDPWADASFIIHYPHAEFNVQDFRDASMAWLEVSDVVFVDSGNGDGGGVDAEIRRAKELKIPIFYHENKLIEWRNKCHPQKQQD